jgi:putative PIN family toxin of toxin-antitoxin system
VVSSLLRPESIPAQALSRAIVHDQIIASTASLAELTEVLRRPKFSRNLALAEVELHLNRSTVIFEVVDVVHTVRDCVDLKDNMILELALSGGADIILSGDDHLLRLHPWRGIRILKPVDYLALQAI